METATKIESVDVGAGDHVVRNGQKAVYKLSKPIDGYDGKSSDHVYLSTACVLGDWETYAFLCDAKGEVISWSELPCSMKGEFSHADVLADAGYSIVPSELPSEVPKP